MPSCGDGHLDNSVAEQKDKEQDSSEAYWPGEIPCSLSDRIKIEYMKCFEHSPQLTISKLDPFWLVSINLG